MYCYLTPKLLTFLSFFLLTQSGKAASSLEKLGDSPFKYKTSHSSSTNSSKGTENPIIQAAFEAARIVDEAAAASTSQFKKINRKDNEAAAFEAAIKAYKASKKSD